MPLGKIVRVVKATGGGSRGRASRSTNIVSKPAYNKRRNKRKYKVAKSFRQAYNKMLPSKEIKFLFQDATMNTNSLANATHIQDLTTIVQGTQMNQRLGSNIHVSYVHFKGSIASNSTVKYKSLRLLLIREINHGKLNTTTFADLLTLSNGYGNIAPSQIQSDGADRVNREQYSVYFDKRYKVPLESEGVRYINERVRISKVVPYAFAEATSSDTIRGHFYLIALLYDNDTATSTTTCPFLLNVTTYFKDFHKM